MQPFRGQWCTASVRRRVAHLRVPLRAKRDAVHETAPPKVASRLSGVQHVVDGAQVLQGQRHAIAVSHLPKRAALRSEHFKVHVDQLRVRLLQPVDLVLRRVLPSAIHEVIAKDLAGADVTQ